MMNLNFSSRQIAIVLLLHFLFTQCGSSPASKSEIGKEINIGGKSYILDTLAILQTDTSSSNFVSEKVISPQQETLLKMLSFQDSMAAKGDVEMAPKADLVKEFSSLSDCMKSFPKGLKGLTGGISLDAYDFKKGDEAKLSILGFGGEIAKNEKITIIEFAQTGSQDCNSIVNNFGVGARLKMKIISNKKGAKLNTPQQITASVVFGKAQVSFQMKTFGIVGPGVSRLIKSGTLSENTYNEFINEIANLIVNAYKKDGDFIITPQLLPFK